MTPPSSPTLGRRAMALIDVLAQYTDEPGRLTRLYLSPAHRAAAEATLGLMRDAGMEAHIDAAGSVVGRRPGADPSAPALLIGSHIDSVVDAGPLRRQSRGRARHRGGRGASRRAPALPPRGGGFRRRGERPVSDPSLDVLGPRRPLRSGLARRARCRRRRPARGAPRLRRRPAGNPGAGPRSGGLSWLSRGPYRAGPAARSGRSSRRRGLRHQRQSRGRAPA